MLNHIVLMGRLTRDPELRHTNSGLPVVGFTIAVDRDFADKQSGQKETDFVDIVAWRNTAEFVSKYFAKGRMAVVSGRLQMRKWEDKEDHKRTSAEVLAESVYFGDSKKDDQGGTYDNRPYVGGGRKANDAEMAGMHGEFPVVDDDDAGLPF